MTTPVSITFGTDTQNVAIARTVAAAMAARADLPVDRVEDVRLAVDEAVSQVLAISSPDGLVTCRFDLVPHALYIEVSTQTNTGRPPSVETFGWMVLSALVDEVTPDLTAGILTLRLKVDRAATVEA